MAMGWKEIDEKLIKRGELLLDLGFLEGYDEELQAMNQGKTGPPYRLANSYIQLLSTIRHLYSMPYRQLEGFTRSLHRLVPQLPQGDYSGLRRRTLALNIDPYSALKEAEEPIAIAVDSTGVKVHRAGGWVERKHGKRKRYVKLHFAVDVESKEVVAMEVSTDDTHDVNAFPRLIERAEERRRISQALGDGAYDSAEAYEELEARGVEPIIKPRRNSRPDTPSPSRRSAVRQYLNLGHQAWARLKGYGRRWMVETAFSTFKRLFGEHSLARTLENIARELVAKVAIYNILVNL
jgi:IS5 family transposase